MKLFIVIQWGRDSAGPAGEDLFYLVRADEFLEAVALVETVPPVNVDREMLSPQANVCLVLGMDGSGAGEAAVILGPVAAPCHACSAYQEGWVRHFTDSPWIALADMGRAYSGDMAKQE